MNWRNVGTTLTGPWCGSWDVQQGRSWAHWSSCVSHCSGESMILESGITGCDKLESQVLYCFPSNRPYGHNSRGLKMNLGFFFILHWVELTRGKNVTVKQKKTWNQGKRINKHKTDTVLLGKKGLDFQSWAEICTLHVSAQWQDISELAFHWPFFPAEQVTFFFFLYFSPLPKDILSFLLIFGTIWSSRLHKTIKRGLSAVY